MRPSTWYIPTKSDFSMWSIIDVYNFTVKFYYENCGYFYQCLMFGFQCWLDNVNLLSIYMPLFVLSYQNVYALAINSGWQGICLEDVDKCTVQGINVMLQLSIERWSRSLAASRKMAGGLSCGIHKKGYSFYREETGLGNESLKNWDDIWISVYCQMLSSALAKAMMLLSLWDMFRT